VVEICGWSVWYENTYQLCRLVLGSGARDVVEGCQVKEAVTTLQVRSKLFTTRSTK